MTRPLRRNDLVYCAADFAVRLHDRDDYSVRHHESVGPATPRGHSACRWRRRPPPCRAAFASAVGPMIAGHLFLVSGFGWPLLMAAS
jgi:hypothetical protein